MTGRAALLPLLLSVALAGPGCAPSGDAGSRGVEEALARMALSERVAQLIVAPLSPGASPASPQLRSLLAGPPVGGVLVRPGEAAPAAEALRLLSARSELPLVVAADLDALGAGASALAARGSPEDARDAARHLARRARETGVNLGLVSTPRMNAEELLPIDARDPERVAVGLRAFLEGADHEGLSVSVRILAASDPARVLDWDRARLEAIEIPLAAGAARDAAVVEVGAARLPSLAGDSLPVAFSRAAVRGLLRRDLGWSGVVAVDLRAGSPLVRGRSAGEAAVRALAAGADLLLGPEHPDSVIAAVVAAVEGGRLPPGRIDAAVRRVLALRSHLPVPADTAGTLPPRPGLPSPEAIALAARTWAATGLDPEAAARVPHLRWPPAPTLRAAEPETVGMDAEALRVVGELVEEAIADSIFTAAAIAVGRRGSLVLLRGWGHTGIEGGGGPVSAATTLFDLASLSKVVGTTTAVALLVDAGGMSLDAPLDRFLPAFEGEGKPEVTVGSLLTHTSGIPSGLWLYGSAGTPREALGQVLEQPLRGPPGSRVEYSDLGMILLAEAVERAAGMPLDRLLALRVFAPLGMQSTMYLPPTALRERIVPTAVSNERGVPLKGVVHDANAFRLGGVAGHAGIFSTARDVAVFAQTMLNGGSYGTVQVISPGTVAAFTRRQPGADERAIGWDTPADRSSAGRYFSDLSYGHTGYTGTSLWIDPEKELFVVLLTNRTLVEASGGEMLRVRADVHEAVARSIRDVPVRPRPGSRPR